MIQISAVIITYNEEKNIERCLKSLSGIVDEIVVIDSFSTDRTIEICNRFNVVLISHEWLGYSKQKNLGNQTATHDYILSVDADEALSEPLKNSILELKNQPFTGAYSVNRMVNYCGHWIKHTSWYPDNKIRIWNKREGKWKGEIHETIEFKSPTSITLLKGDLHHYTYYTEEEHIAQQVKFSTIAAQDMFNQGKRAPLYKLILNPLASFIKDMIIRSGYLDGASGLKISIISAKSVYWKYKKLRQHWQNQESV
tara:strand:- start:143739 stop:144500 length:762 start_codon:yes stop_codon:yes gene_type:complete